jgi:phosphoserine phosphatase
MRPALIILLKAALLLILAAPAAAADLALWNDGPVRTDILDYLAAVTDPDHPDFIPVAERVAVLDNDGTFWCERPDYASTMFQRSLLISMIDQGKVDGARAPYPAWRAYDRDALRAFGWSEAYRRMNMAFAGMPVATYRDSATAWLDRHPHSEFQVRHTELYYRPMLELARLLEANGFQVWVVTGAAQDFVRSYIEQAAGIPPERVIGSWTPARTVLENDTITVVRDSVQVYNGYQAKTANIETRIGRRPVFAAGNSNNDHPMCLYAVTGPRRGLALWIHHDDREREYDYDRGTDRIRRLTEQHPDAHEVSIRRHWRRVFREGITRD